MKRILKTPARWLELARRRSGMARPRARRTGSVLILVVALLVLMAIIGTAYVSTARTDRIASLTNSQNTQIDLLVQGVRDMAVSEIIADIQPLNGLTPTYRTSTPLLATWNSSNNGDYAPFNSASFDPWLADRVPVPLDPTSTVNLGDPNPLNGGNPAINHVVWRFISYPQYTADNSTALEANTFETPVNFGTTLNTYGGVSGLPTNYGGVNAYFESRSDYAPTYVRFTDANGLNQIYPALMYWDANAEKFEGPYLAADTDGDGIADAAMFRLTVTPVNGVTYYGAFRVVDNAAAINASTAWTPQPVTTSPQQTLPGDYFPCNVDLGSLVPDALTNFNTWRFGNGGTPSPSPGASETTGGFSFLTQYDAVWYELGRRLQNPISPYQSLSVTDSAEMASQFVLHNPDSTPSTLEQYLPLATFANKSGYGITTPFLASDVSDWYNWNFSYQTGQQPSTLSLRSILVGRNPVSNFVANKYGVEPAGATTSRAYNSGDTYNFGDWVTYAGYSYVNIQPCTNQWPGRVANADTGYYNDTAYWVYEPWYDWPTKTSVNTATFGQLWLAYWNVMCDTQNALPGGFSTTSQTTVGPNMFRSSLRNNGQGAVSAAGTSPLSGTQEIQLRASLAAINTLSLRTTANATAMSPTDPSTNPTVLSANVPLSYNGSTTSEYTVQVFGVQPQPYITEVYADNDPTLVGGTTGYIAIELYNPYPFPLVLTNWALVTVPRPDTPGATALTLTQVTGTTSWSTSAPTIPAFGCAVLANAATPGAYTPPFATTANQGSPTAASPPLYIVPGLDAAFGNDLVLMRPPSPTTAFTTAAGIPVDSYDFTGLNKQATFAAGVCDEWHYARDNTNAWHCVYPGPYNPTAGADGLHPRFLGTAAPLAVVTAGVPTFTNLSTFGKTGTQTTGYGATYDSVPIQLDNVDFGGPLKLKSTGNTFPFGQFPRNADIQQVPFIGSYMVYSGSTPSAATLVDMMPITLDSAFAAVTNTYVVNSTTNTEALALANYGSVTSPGQNIGMFVPWYPNDYYSAGYFPRASSASPYSWAFRLLDYLTVQAPNDDYIPNTDPIQYATGVGAPGVIPQGVANVKAGITNANTGNTSGLTEETAPVEGLININTAPWRVLDTLPFADASDGGVTNAAVAQAIVNYRDGYWSFSTNSEVTPFSVYSYPNEPEQGAAFQSILDLNGVSAKVNPSLSAATVQFSKSLGSFGINGYNPATSTPTNNDGDLTPLSYTALQQSPAWPTSDGVHGDAEKQNLAVARVSNLITTRSDSYTVYIEVQGWRNAGNATTSSQPPTLVVQRRLAFIVDRSGYLPASPAPVITNVPTN